MRARKILTETEESLKAVAALIQKRFHELMGNVGEKERDSLKSRLDNILLAIRNTQKQFEQIQEEALSNDNNDMLVKCKKLIKTAQLHLEPGGRELLSYIKDEDERKAERKIFDSIFKALEKGKTALDEVLKLVSTTENPIPIVTASEDYVITAKKHNPKKKRPKIAAEPLPNETATESPANETAAEPLVNETTPTVTAPTPPPRFTREELEMFFSEGAKRAQQVQPTIEEKAETTPAPTVANEPPITTQPIQRENTRIEIDPITAEVKEVPKSSQKPVVEEPNVLIKFIRSITNAFRTVFSTIVNAFSKEVDTHKNIHEDAEKNAEAFYADLNSSAKSVATMAENGGNPTYTPPKSEQPPTASEIRKIAQAAADLGPKVPASSKTPENK